MSSNTRRKLWLVGKHSTCMCYTLRSRQMSTGCVAWLGAVGATVLYAFCYFFLWSNSWYDIQCISFCFMFQMFCRIDTIMDSRNPPPPVQWLFCLMTHIPITGYHHTRPYWTRSYRHLIKFSGTYTGTFTASSCVFLGRPWVQYDGDSGHVVVVYIGHLSTPPPTVQWQVCPTTHISSVSTTTPDDYVGYWIHFPPPYRPLGKRDLTQGGGSSIETSISCLNIPPKWTTVLISRGSGINTPVVLTPGTIGKYTGARGAVKVPV